MTVLPECHCGVVSSSYNLVSCTKPRKTVVVAAAVCSRPLWTSGTAQQPCCPESSPAVSPRGSRSRPLTPGFQDRGLVPVIGRHGNAPDVSWLIKFDPAVQRVLRIDIDNPSRRTLIRQVDVNRDSHSTAQPNRGCDQCSVKVDDDGLAIARPRLRATLNRDNHL